MCFSGFRIGIITAKIQQSIKADDVKMWLCMYMCLCRPLFCTDILSFEMTLDFVCVVSFGSNFCMFPQKCGISATITSQMHSLYQEAKFAHICFSVTIKQLEPKFRSDTYLCLTLLGLMISNVNGLRVPVPVMALTHLHSLCCVSHVKGFSLMFSSWKIVMHSSSTNCAVELLPLPASTHAYAELLISLFVGAEGEHGE